LSKDSEKHSRQGYAHNNAHLRDKVFGVPGFKSNDRTPSLAQANEMAGQRLRTMAGRAVVNELKTPTVVK